LRRILEEQLEKKIEETIEGLPERFEFGEGTELFCEIVDVMKNPWREDGSKIYIVKNLDDGRLYRLPTHRVLDTELTSQNAEKGDIALIKLVSTYKKTVESGEIRTVNVYRAVIYKQSKKQETVSDKEVEEYVKDLMKLFNGRVPEDQFRHFIEEVRGWKVEEVISKCGLKKEGSFVVGA